jgi:hypothetical protein
MRFIKLLAAIVFILCVIFIWRSVYPAVQDIPDTVNSSDTVSNISLAENPIDSPATNDLSADNLFTNTSFNLSEELQSEMESLLFDEFIPEKPKQGNTTLTSETNTTCPQNFTISSPENNVVIYMSRAGGKIDVMFQRTASDEIICSNGVRVSEMRDCIPDGLMDFLNKPIVAADLIEFKCSSGLVTGNVQECMPAYATAPPESFVTLKCKGSNTTIEDFDCRDVCYAEKVSSFLDSLAG